MKRLILAAAVVFAAISVCAKTNYTILRACHPDDVKHYDTEELRSHFMMPKVMEENVINLTYSMYDSIIYGGVVPVGQTVELETIDLLKANYFLERRELGVVNVGGAGIISVDGKDYELNFKDALYVGRGVKSVTFRSKDAAAPARFYLNSTPAHKAYKTQLVTIDSIKANRIKAGSLEESHDRIINQLIVANVLEEGPCQLQMGLTELMPGSVWNTMPAHTHDRRVECYFYFNVPEGRQRHLPSHGPAAGEPPHMASQRAGSYVARMEHTCRRRHVELHVHLGHGRRKPRLRRHGQSHLSRNEISALRAVHDFTGCVLPDTACRFCASKICLIVEKILSLRHKTLHIYDRQRHQKAAPRSRRPAYI